MKFESLLCASARPAAVALAAALALLVCWSGLVSPPGAIAGAEQGHIAVALASGRGYADPFGTPSGPTAWVPPFNPVLMAAVFKLFGIATTKSALVLALIRLPAFAVAFYLLLRCLDRLGWPKGKPWLAAILALQCWFLHSPLFYNAVTIWPTFVCLAWLIHDALAFHQGRQRRYALRLSVLGLLVPLIHGGLSAAYFAVVAVLAWQHRREHPAPAREWLRLPAAAGLALAVSVGAWTTRNYLVFDRFVPLKSNGAFELDLTFHHTARGVLSAGAVMAHHPSTNETETDRYTRLGERNYLEQVAAGLWPDLRAHPGRYARQVGWRFVNAFVFAENVIDTVPFLFAGGHTSMFSLATDARLATAGLWVTLPRSRLGVWLCLDLAPDEFLARLRALHLPESEKIFRAWLESKEAFVARRSVYRELLQSLLVSGLPVLVALASGIGRGGRPPALVGFAALIYVVYLLPNVLITHDATHQTALFGLQALFFVYGGRAIVAAARRL